MTKLTPAKLDVLHAASVEYIEHGHVTIRSIAERIWRSKPTTWRHVHDLIAMGLLDMDEGKQGTIRPGSVS